MSASGNFQRVELKHACRMINHGPTVLITSRHGDRRNLMAAAWSMPVEFVPPRVAVVIDKRTYTWELVRASGSFAICVPGRSMIDVTYAVGSTSGRDLDKFAHFGIESATGPELAMPVIENGCCAWLECRLIPEPHTQEAYDTCFAEVVAAAADPRIFERGHWSVRDDNSALHTIHHLGGGNFAVGSSAVRARDAPSQGF